MRTATTILTIIIVTACSNVRYCSYPNPHLPHPHLTTPTPQVWNLENMLPILALQRHEKPIRSLAIYRDSVFTGSEDMEIKVSHHTT